MKKLLFPFLVAMSATLPGVTGTGCNMQSCTEMGCSNLVTFDVSDVFDAFQGQFPVALHACVGAVCSDAKIDVGAAGTTNCTTLQAVDCTVDATGVLHIGVDIGSATNTKATIELLGQDGVTKFTAEGAVTLKEFLPNGEGCGGACNQGIIAFTAKVN